MTIEPKTTKYVETAVDRAIERKMNVLDKNIKTYVHDLNEENKRHMAALKEFFHDEANGLARLIKERPTRDETREITHEEIESSLRPINAKLDFLNEERHAMLDAIADIKA